MAFAPLSAKSAKVRIGAGPTTITAKKWTVAMKVDELDTSNFEGNGYTDRIAGLKDATITIEFDIDTDAAGTNPWDAAGYNFTPGTVLATVKLYLNDTTGPFWLFTSAIILDFNNPTDVKEALKGTVTMKNKGTITPPTGDISP